MCTRIHDIDFVKSAMENTDFEITSLNKNCSGFVMCGISKSKKSQLTGIQYVKSEDIEVDVDYNIVYDANEYLVNLSAQSVEADYEENLNFSPDMSVEGKFDGTINLNGQEINIFDIDEENEESIEECAIYSNWHISWRRCIVEGYCWYYRGNSSNHNGCI